MTIIRADIIADSRNPSGARLTTFVCTFHRFILAELNKHCALSSSTASSRAVPIAKTIRQVWSDPAMPVRWGRNGKGMVDHGDLSGWRLSCCRGLWRLASRVACLVVWLLSRLGLHKAWANRLLEPWAWSTAIISGTDWLNFFGLRVHPDAQPEFQALAVLMLRAYLGREPANVGWGDWHVPFSGWGLMGAIGLTEDQKRRAAVGRCARVSYMTHDGRFSLAEDVALADRCEGNGHWVPFAHVAQAAEGRHANFDGFEQMRHQLPGGAGRTKDLRLVQAEYEAAVEARRAA